ncbi:unnamed protein product [Orchesella dallaii]|uniref:Uncharacterized protein n=1 Tax=Orchesella dallaii TaxID=48710 RepID=A0ABP1R9F1_9HEXA
MKYIYECPNPVSVKKTLLFSYFTTQNLTSAITTQIRNYVEENVNQKPHFYNIRTFTSFRELPILIFMVEHFVEMRKAAGKHKGEGFTSFIARSRSYEKY